VDWSVDDPCVIEGSPEEIRAAYEATYDFLSRNVRDLVGAVLGVTID